MDGPDAPERALSDTRPSNLARSAPGDALAILHAHGETVTTYLRSLKECYPEAPPRLLEAIEYSLLAGGKRLRPALVLEAVRACGGRVEGEGANRSALAGAAAVELIHTFSLVHDDLPAMDNDDLRRGRPTNHKVFGEAMAILAGDAMVAIAFELLATEADITVGRHMAAELASATGPAGMIGGQVLDMEGEHQALSMDQLRRLHRMKTGALLTSSCRIGAIAAGAGSEVVELFGNFGRHLGLAFQIVDDLLDVTSTPEQMGKATNKDAHKGENTYPRLLGLEQSRHEAQQQLAAAVAALQPLGAEANGLKALARFVVDRKT